MTQRNGPSWPLRKFGEAISPHWCGLHQSHLGLERDYKMYIFILTCMSIGAVHIELVLDMSVSSFIQAFVRFTDVNRISSHLLSGNTRTFITTARIIDKGLITDEFREKFATHHLKYCAIPLYSAWNECTWKRIIKIIKTCLYKTI